MHHLPPLALFVTYFETGPDVSTFRPLLARWLKMYRASGCTMPLRIITDVDTMRAHAAATTYPAPANQCAELFGVPAFVVDPRPFERVMRPGNAYDRKSAIICAALPHLPRSVIVDTDAFLQHDPTAALQAFADEAFAMAEDSGRRAISLTDGTNVTEQSSSVMVFGAPLPSEAERWKIARQYEYAWLRLAEAEAGAHPVAAWLSAIREQRAWSLVRSWRAAPLLPRTLNWSRVWGMNPQALIHHAHGPEKWSYRAPTDPLPDGFPGGAAFIGPR